MRSKLCRVLVKGGVISPSELLQIIDFVEACGLDFIHFGSRQDILYPQTAKLEEVGDQFPGIYVEELSKGRYQNIVSSYVSADILPSTSWLTSTIYLYILEQFSYSPTLKINITDPLQRLVPLFTGDLNFIASPHPDYWYLFMNLPGPINENYYPALIHTWNIEAIAQAIEHHYTQVNTIEALFDLINNKIDTQNRTIDRDLVIDYHPFPYYEGMNRMNLDQYWLGLYWRNNKYDLRFLRALCELCAECRVGKVCITPWKSFIVKGIHEDYKLNWEKLLGKYGVNVRHSSLELNWHLPVSDLTALELKRFLVRNFDQNDISTYGLTFGISSPWSKNFTSIVVDKNPMPAASKKFEIRPTFNVQYSQDFDPNTRIYNTYAQDVDKVELPGLLMELSQMYFEQLGESKYQLHPSSVQESKSDPEEIEIYQCSACLSIYDPRFGEPDQHIDPGTPFQKLPAEFQCPVCQASKAHFQPRLMSTIK